MTHEIKASLTDIVLALPPCLATPIAETQGLVSGLVSIPDRQRSICAEDLE